MRGDSLAGLVRSYLDDNEVTLLPDDPNREPRLNTWSYRIPDGLYRAETRRMPLTSGFADRRQACIEFWHRTGLRWPALPES
jgi:hypothetical protein